MKPPRFAYCSPATVGEALGVLAEHGPDALPLAGGQSLLPLLNRRQLHPRLLVDLRRLAELRTIGSADGDLTVGALMTTLELRQLPVGGVDPNLLADALAHVGNVAVQSRGTVGGMTALADPAAELPVVLRALDAEILVRAAGGDRTVPAAELYAGPFRTTLAAGELVTGVRVTLPSARAGSAFVEVARRASTPALASAAAVVERDDAGRVVDVRIALGGVAEVPLRAEAAERMLRGSRLEEAAVEEAAQVAAAGLDPRTDALATGTYRKQVTSALVARALRRADERGNEGVRS